MRIKERAGALARGYVKTARAFALVLLIAVPFFALAAVYAQSSPQGSLTVVVSGSKAGTNLATTGYVIPTGTNAYVEGNVTISGDYTGPVYLVGSVHMQLANTPIGRPSSMSWIFWNDSFTWTTPPGQPDFPSGYYTRYSTTADQQISFYSQDYYSAFGFSVTSYYGTITAYSDPAHTTSLGESSLVGGTAPTNPTYTLGIELPLINDPMLGATVNATDATGDPSPTFPSSFGGIYNFLMVVAFAIIGVGAGIALFTGAGGGRDRDRGGGMSPVLMQVVIGVVLAIIFPLVYDQIAQLVNYMTKVIIAYPSPDVNAYAINLQHLWDTASFGSAGSWSGAIWAGLVQFAVWIMELIADIMVYVLGTLRIFLMAVVIAGFPLAVGLRMVPFAGKLSQAVEDTLFGLILAAIMSAVVAAVANLLISQPNWALTAVGDQADWIAIVAIFVIVLMPTVFAPLTATMMQTVSQAAMVGGGVAAAVGMGVAGPAAGGAVAGGRAAVGAFGGAMSKAVAGSPVTLGMMSLAAGGAALGPSRFGAFAQGMGSGARAFTGTFKRHAAMPMLKNAAIVGSTSVVGAVGGINASRAVSGMMPRPVGPGEVIASQRAEQLAGQQAQTMSGISQTMQSSFNAAISNAPNIRLAPEQHQEVQNWITNHVAHGNLENFGSWLVSHHWTGRADWDALTAEQRANIFQNFKDQAVALNADFLNGPRALWGLMGHLNSRVGGSPTQAGTNTGP